MVRSAARGFSAATPIRLLDLLNFAKSGPAGSARANGRRLVHEEVSVRLGHQLVRSQRLGAHPRLRASCAATLGVIAERLQHSLNENAAVRLSERDKRETHVALFTKLKQRHATDLQLVARAFKSLCDSLDAQHADSADVDAQLDAYFRMSLGLNVLIDQSLFVDEDEAAGRGPPHIPGIVRERADIAPIVRDAAEIARELCERELCDAPEVQLAPQEPCVPPAAETSVPCIPHLVHAALLEVLKNAVRASTLRARATGGEGEPISPISVRVAPSAEDVAVVIDDAGGGIARSRADRLLFGFCRSTAKPPLDEGDACAHLASGGSADVDASRGASPLAGFGVGIPYARSQLRPLGGDLRVPSVHGLGTRVCCWMPRDALHAHEEIPLFP